jgi:Ca2+-binding RTX toxin-like protein
MAEILVDQGGAGNYTTIQEAINHAGQGDTIHVASGTYTENLTVNVNDLTIVGDPGVVVAGSFKTDNGLSTGDSVADFLFSAPSYSTAAGTGITVAAVNVSIQNLTIQNFANGIELANGTDHVSIQDVAITGTINGVRKGAAAEVSHVQVTGGSIEDSYIGMYFAKETATGGDLNGLTVSGTSFSHLTQKGIYAETLSDALISDIEMTDVGQMGRGTAFGGLGTFGNGIDINLKWDHEAAGTAGPDDDAPYSNIVIDGFEFHDVGSNSLGGAAIAVKARDDAPNYSGPESASFDGAVVIKNGIIDGAPVGIRVGEPNKPSSSANVTGPDVDVQNVVITDVTADVDNVSKSTVTVDMADGDNTFVAMNTTTSTGDIVVNGTDDADDITTAAGNDTLNGNGGNDHLNGGSGTDTMAGGEGNDTYVVDNAGDTAVEQASQGTDTVLSSVSYTLGDNVENLTLLDGASDTQTFEDMDLGPIANGENSWIVLAPGADQEVVLDTNGNKVFRMSSDPASGAFAGPYSPGLPDSAGEPGTSARYDSQLIKFTVQAVNAIPDGSRLEIDFGNVAANDRNNFMVIESFGASGGLRIAVSEPDTSGNFSGNDSSPAPDDWRELATGIDPTVAHTIELRLTYVAGPDNDIIDVYLDGVKIGTTTTFENYHDVVSGLTHEESAELYQTNRVFFRPSANGAPQDGPGGLVNQGFYIDDLHTVVYNSANATGNALDNILTGNLGDNRLDGKAGADTMAGGQGNDTYVVDVVGDTVTELAGQGADTVESSIDYTLGPNVENLVLTGLAGINGTGNALDNSITGNAGSNRLDGGAGADVLKGGAGNDTYVVDASDSVVEQAGGGTGDTVEASFSYTLDANVENLVLTGTGNIDGTGNGENNTLTGNSGVNVLNGAAGTDTLIGGAGNDQLVGGSEVDTAKYGQAVDSLAIASGPGGWTVTTGAEGTDSLSGVEIVEGSDGGRVLLVGHGGFGTIQEAIDEAQDGDTILISDGTYTEALSIDGKAITLQAEGNGAILQAPAGTNAITLTGNFGAGDVSVLGLKVHGSAAAPNQGIGVYVTEDANIGTLTLDGVSIQDAGSFGVFVDGENNDPLPAAANIVITNSTFSHNGYNGANGAAHIKLFGFPGNALIQNVTMDGASNADPVTQWPDYGIELTGTPNSFLPGGTTVAMGTVTIDNVTMTGFMEKNGLAIYNYANIGGLSIGPNSPVDLSGLATVWGYVLNVDGVLGTVDASGFGIILPAAATIAAALQGDKPPNQAATDQTIVGTSANDLLVGKGGADILRAGAGNDQLHGGGGAAAGDDDLLDGGTGADIMTGGAGDDSYVVDDAGDQVVEAANEGNDTVSSSIDYVLGNNVENLTLTGSAVNGTGNGLDNHIIGNNEDNVLDGQGGNDQASGGLGNDQLLGGAGDDQLNGEAGDDLLVGGIGKDKLDGGAGTDSMFGGSGDDTYTVDVAGDSINESANQGTDTVRSSMSYTLGTNLENLELLGSANLNGTGNTAANHLKGNSGGNTLNGGAGVDTMEGGAGNDRYIVDAIGEVVTEQANEGTDLVTSSVDFTLGANIENLTLTGTAINGTGNALNNTITGNGAANLIDGGAGVDTMSGGAGDDIYIVSDVGDRANEGVDQGTDTVRSSITFTLGANLENLELLGSSNINGTGNTAANHLTGNSGANVLNGGAGADIMEGGAGNDSYFVDVAGDVVIEQANEGTDLVTSSVDFTLGANIENLTLAGAAAINGTGNALNNNIIGNGAANLIDGGAGVDTMSGGAGDDIYIVSDAGDTVSEGVGQGTDTVRSSIGFALGANLENLELQGVANINGIGNTANNHIIGNTGNNVLNGGAGADTMEGGDGNDSYFVDVAGDVVIEEANEGTDLVTSAVDYSLGANIERLTLTGTAINAIGNDLNNTIIGNDQDNFIDGGAGVDTMSGGAGDDTYIVSDVGDRANEGVGKGTDTVMSSVTYSLGTAEVEILVLTGAGNINGTGNQYDNEITGNSGNNTLTGGAGADTLDGGAGVDKLIGGDGNDSYVVDNVGDIVTELAGQGTDQVTAFVSYALTANVENLTLAGSAISGTGNSLANQIIGNALDNTLDGGAGADTMTGGAGNDSYVVDNDGDVVNELANQGTDHVTASVSFTLSANVENLTLTGAASEGIGNDLANQIQGNAQNNLLVGAGGDDTLDGGAGVDTLTGGTGNDSYVVDNDGDVVNELVSQGIDHVTASLSFSLSDNVEDLTLIGSATDGTGNDLANQIVGNSQDNSLDGAAGSDVLSGGDGNDALTGGLGNDHLDGGADDDLVLGGAGNDSLAGGTGADILSGGTGHDTFVFDTPLVAGNVDTITDFTVVVGLNNDLFNLSQSVFTEIGLGTLSAAAFHVGSAATDGAQRVIYNNTTGALSYDLDGSGAAAAVQFATLTTHPALTNDYFVVV